MPGRRDERIVDTDRRERAERPTLRAQLVKLRNLLVERAAGQRSSERRFLEWGDAAISRLLLAQSQRAGVFLLLVAPDAVMRLVEASGKIGTAIGEREAFAPTQMIVGQSPRLNAIVLLVLDGNEVYEVELARRFEKNAIPVQPASLGRMRGPRRIAKREVDLAGMRRFVRAPFADETREAELSVQRGQRLADERFQPQTQCIGVEASRIVGLVLVHRFALHDLALAGKERRQLALRRLQSAYLALDAEE